MSNYPYSNSKRDSVPNTNFNGEGDLPEPYTNPNLGNPPDKLARAGESR